MHEIQCSKNPDKYSPQSGRKSWNKGLTKDTDSRVAKRVHTLRINHESGKTVFHGHTTSEETKKKLSVIRKKYLDDNPDKVPYVLNHSSQKSYPEKYFEDCFLDIKNDIEMQYRVLRYCLDFANPKEKLYLEIDGEQHYLDKRIVKHDEIRTKVLLELGWTGIRVRWSSFQKLSKEAKELKIKEIRSMMKWYHS